MFYHIDSYILVWNCGHTLHDDPPERDGHPDPTGQGSDQAGQQVHTVQPKGKLSWLVVKRQKYAL